MIRQKVFLINLYFITLIPIALQTVISMTTLKYYFYKLQKIMQQFALNVNKLNQAKPKTDRQTTYFCRLCRNYGIKTRKAHLQNFHNANRDTVTKRSNVDLVNTIFIESN